MKRLFKILGVLVALLVVAFLIFRTPDTDPVEMRAKYGGEPSQFVTLGDGLTVHLRDEGPRDAPAIILLHGSNADLHTWQPWVDGLKDAYRVIRFDQPGHGLTGAAPSGDYSTAAYVEAIDEVADALGLQRFILGGNSMGGYHTLVYAMERPERVVAMILVDAGGPPVKPKGGGNIGFTLARLPVLNQAMKYITPRSLVEQSLSQSVSNKAIVTSESVDRYWELLRYPGNREATMRRFSQDRTLLTAEQAAGLEMPSLVLWGTEDALIPVEAGRWLDANLPASAYAEFENVGHLPMEEAPEETLAVLREWLATLELTRPA